MGKDDYEMSRICAGRPAAGSELTEAHNPLEAGLYKAVSVSKGTLQMQTYLCSELGGVHGIHDGDVGIGA